MAGYALRDRHFRALRDIVVATTVDDPTAALPFSVLEQLRSMLDCDFALFEGVDYGSGYSYFCQSCDPGGESFRGDGQPGEKDEFWTLVRSSSLVDPWIPKDESASVVTPLDFMSVRQWRSLPVYVDGFRDGPTTTHELIGSVADGERRQLRLLLFRRSGRAFTERERFDVQLLMPHLEGAYRRGQRQRVRARLTGRQASLMSFVRDGLTNHQIARRMDVSEGTVRIHLNNIYARLGVGSRTEAATRLFGHGGPLIGVTHSDANGALPIAATGCRWESGSATHA